MKNVYLMEYDLAQRRKDTLSHAKTWTNLGYIILNEVNKSQKDTY